MRTRTGQGGSLSLEMAMALPVLALCAVVLLQGVGVARDALLAQELARLGARVAATSPSDAAVRDAVARAAGPDVDVAVMISPPVRGHGTTIRVRVDLHRPDRPIDVRLRGSAVAHGEPQLERP
jgi:hypothetical protein